MSDITMHYKHMLENGNEIFLTAIFNHDCTECKDITGTFGDRWLSEPELASLVTNEIMANMIDHHFKKSKKKLRVIK